MKIKKVSGLCIAMLMMLLFLFPITVSADVKEQPSRAINIVFDDSTSMIIDDITGQPVDRWCQAKYAMEVFASMLGEKDTMNIYAMSTFTYTAEGEPVLSVSGSDPVESRVQSVHNMITNAATTPFESADQAFSDLQQADADEKWLLILTDGVFNVVSGGALAERNQDYVKSKIDSFISGGAVKVIYLAMAENVADLQSDEDSGFYFERAKTSSDILKKITDISNLIFQQNKIVAEDNSGYYFSTDIPLSEAVVFAQGPSVVIECLENEETGEKIEMNSSVSVRYSEKATTRSESYYQPPNLIINDKLTGVVANFGQMSAGKYKIKVSGATDVEVYYKPNVNIVARLFDGEGNEMKEGRFVEGTYRLEFGLADPETGKILNSSLLGEVEYEAVVTMNGSEKEMKSGDEIILNPGDLNISVSGTYLDYNKVSDELSYEVFYASKDLEFVVEAPEKGWQLTKDALTAVDSNKDYLLVTAYMEGAPITQQMWDEMETIEVSSKKNVEFLVEKGSEVGTFKVYPQAHDDDPLDTDSGTISIKVSGNCQVDGQDFAGKGEGTFEITSEISLLEKIIHLLKKYWWILLIIILLTIIIVAFWKRKLLPKKLTATNLEYIPKLGVSAAPGSSMRFSKTKKWWHQSGSIVLEGKGITPLYVSISVQAINNWTVKNRKALVTGFNASPTAIKTISIGADFEYDPEKNRWVNGAGKTPSEAGNVRVGKGTNITIIGTTTGQTYSVTLK